MMMHAKPAFRNPWACVPSLYLAEGTPYVVAALIRIDPAFGKGK